MGDVPIVVDVVGSISDHLDMGGFLGRVLYSQVKCAKGSPAWPPLILQCKEHNIIDVNQIL